MFSPHFDPSFMLYNSHSAARSIYLWRDTVACCNNEPYFLWAEKRSNPTCSLYLCETCNQLLHSIWKLLFSSYCNYCCPFTGHKLDSIYSSTRIKLWPKPGHKYQEQGTVFVQSCFWEKQRGFLSMVWMAILIIFPRDEVTFLMAQSWREESLLLTVCTQTDMLARSIHSA